MARFVLAAMVMGIGFVILGASKLLGVAIIVFGFFIPILLQKDAERNKEKARSDKIARANVVCEGCGWEGRFGSALQNDGRPRCRNQVFLHVDYSGILIKRERWRL